MRKLISLHEQQPQELAADLQEVLLRMAQAAAQWREQGARCLPPRERDDWIAQYFEVLARGYAAQPPPPGAEVAKRRGPPKQSAAIYLLNDLLLHADRALAVLDDLSIPFTSHQAEQDLHLLKV